MKTNCTQVKKAVQQTLIDCMNFDGQDEQPQGLKDQLTFIIQDFVRTHLYDYNRKSRKSYQELFIEYLRDGSSVLNLPFYTDDIIEVMVNEWNLPQPENKTNEDSIRLFYILLHREFITLCNKNNIDFYTLTR